MLVGCRQLPHRQQRRGGLAVDGENPLADAEQALALREHCDTRRLECALQVVLESGANRVAVREGGYVCRRARFLSGPAWQPAIAESTTLRPSSDGEVAVPILGNSCLDDRIILQLDKLRGHAS